MIIDEIRKRSDEAWGHVYIIIHNIDGPGARYETIGAMFDLYPINLPPEFHIVTPPRVKVV